jgi:hypothetical protein
MVRLRIAHQGVEVNKTAQNGPTALMLASHSGHLEVVRLLLAREGVEVNKSAADGAAALLFASQNGHVEVMRLLLASEVNMSAAGGATALLLASQKGHVKVVRLLLARQGVEVNKSAQNGGTALIVASENDHVEVVRLLLARENVEANQTSTYGMSTLGAAGPRSPSSSSPSGCSLTCTAVKQLGLKPCRELTVLWRGCGCPRGAGWLLLAAKGLYLELRTCVAGAARLAALVKLVELDGRGYFDAGGSGGAVLAAASRCRHARHRDRGGLREFAQQGGAGEWNWGSCGTVQVTTTMLKREWVADVGDNMAGSRVERYSSHARPDARPPARRAL